MEICILQKTIVVLLLEVLLWHLNLRRMRLDNE